MNHTCQQVAATAATDAQLKLDRKEEKLAVKAVKKRNKEARKLLEQDAESAEKLYLLHWHQHAGAATAPLSSDAEVVVSGLREDFKRLEKVAKVSVFE